MAPLAHPLAKAGGGGEEAAKAVAARDGVIPMFPPRISGRSGALIALWLLLPVVACDQGGSSPALPPPSGVTLTMSQACNAIKVSSMLSPLARPCSSMVRIVEPDTHRNHPSTSPIANTWAMK